jgi:hypothetical protein
MATVVAILFGLTFVACPLAGVAAEKQITDVKALAGTWHGWLTAPFGQERATIVVKEDGSYKASTTHGALTLGNFYLQDGKLRYRSSLSAGAATVSEDRDKTFLTVIPEGTEFLTGPAEYQRAN